MAFRRRLNSYLHAGLVAFVGAMVLLRWGHGSLYGFAEGALLGMAIVLLLVGMRRASRCTNSP
jgi:hypothetical protein